MVREISLCDFVFLFLDGSHLVLNGSIANPVVDAGSNPAVAQNES